MKRKVLAAMMAATLALSLADVEDQAQVQAHLILLQQVRQQIRTNRFGWFNRQPSNSSTGELDKEALNFNDDTYYVGFDANQGAELQGEMVVDYIKAMQTRSTEMVMESSDMYCNW